MLTILKMDAENTVGMRVDGKIETPEFEALIEVLEAKMKSQSDLRLYVELVSFKGFSLDAFFKDLKFALSNFNRFKKKALVTDARWMQRVSGVGDKLTPNIEVKAFSFEEKAAAIEWAQT
ncbi:STAS/SEC14 domain-containing protein [Bradymonas sediminis]|uniref:STAS/SEC14 domain-containing protein n=1 Tax=Bradymonas sediminis TaxID=1548548 RepID=A0A2Z4FG56_9DELT|nr:STAS/SEC14 domain-containing protein [Bradymonas sediminis]AWV87910.1 STAS/SEC14 domain-containing protein [Bradymonas sediminis]TDP62927.1 SpoIIAA-like protein [Bradymonas sediminis]